MAEAIYLLCFLTSLAVAVLLLRGYRESQARLLLWSGLCFVGLTLNNGILFLDRVILPGMDLSVPRQVTGFLGVCFLLYGLVWDAE